LFSYNEICIFMLCVRVWLDFWNKKSPIEYLMLILVSFFQSILLSLIHKSCPFTWQTEMPLPPKMFDLHQ
jgi:hypothetical protein